MKRRQSITPGKFPKVRSPEQLRKLLLKRQKEQENGRTATRDEQEHEERDPNHTRP
jgi:hypothetical protein